MKTARNILVIAILAVVAFLGSYFWVVRKPAAPVKEQPTLPTVTVVTPEVEQGEQKFASTQVKVPEGQDALKVSVEHLVITRNSPFPKGTRVLSIAETKNLVTIDFSKELVRNFEGGSSEEAALINSLCKTLEQFPEILQLQITVDGKKIESIGEHIDVSQPIDIRKPLSE